MLFNINRTYIYGITNSITRGWRGWRVRGGGGGEKGAVVEAGGGGATKLEGDIILYLCGTKPTIYTIHESMKLDLKAISSLRYPNGV